MTGYNYENTKYIKATNTLTQSATKFHFYFIIHAKGAQSLKILEFLPFVKTNNFLLHFSISRSC